MRAALGGLLLVAAVVPAWADPAASYAGAWASDAKACKKPFATIEATTGAKVVVATTVGGAAAKSAEVSVAGSDRLEAAIDAGGTTRFLIFTPTKDGKLTVYLGVLDGPKTETIGGVKLVGGKEVALVRCGAVPVAKPAASSAPPPVPVAAKTQKAYQEALAKYRVTFSAVWLEGSWGRVGNDGMPRSTFESAACEADEVAFKTYMRKPLDDARRKEVAPREIEGPGKQKLKVQGAAHFHVAGGKLYATFGFAKSFVELTPYDPKLTGRIGFTYSDGAGARKLQVRVVEPVLYRANAKGEWANVDQPDEVIPDRVDTGSFVLELSWGDAMPWRVVRCVR